MSEHANEHAAPPPPTEAKPSIFTRAARHRVKARVALAGPSGSGKTFDALIWATALGERVAVIDTERDSASLYADMFAFDSVAFPPPFKPSRLIKLIGIAAAEGYDVLVIDSLSHFWEGEGGALDMVDAAAARAGGNSFAGWKVATPEFRALVDAMLGCPMHLIATMRSKMEYVLEADARGKQAPRKVGMQPVMRAGIEYEFTVVADLDLEHRLVVSKSRCSALADLIAPPDHVEAAAQRFAAWLREGDPASNGRAPVEELG